MGSPLRRSIFSIFGSLVTTLIELAFRKSVDQGRMATDSVPFVRECLQNNPHTDTFNPSSKIPSAAHCKTGRLTANPITGVDLAGLMNATQNAAAATLAAALITAAGRPHSVDEALELLRDIQYTLYPGNYSSDFTLNDANASHVYTLSSGVYYFHVHADARDGLFTE